MIKESKSCHESESIPDRIFIATMFSDCKRTFKLVFKYLHDKVLMWKLVLTS